MSRASVVRLGGYAATVALVLAAGLASHAHAQAASYTGSFDTLSSPYAQGWALNNNDQSQAVSVQVYLNAPYNQGGTYVGSPAANQPRPDLNAAGISGDHGYQYSIPNQFLDGKAHAVYAYATAANGSLTNLPGSPKTGTLGAPPQALNGSLDGFTSGAPFGWALDGNDYTKTITVQIYFDAPYNQGGTYVGSPAANQPRPDLNAAGISGDHGYQYSIPNQFLDGKAHAVYAYATAANGSLTNLPGSPKTTTFSCAIASCYSPIPLQSNDGSIKVETIGSAQTVFRHSTDACTPDDIPDGHPRAFRNASGSVILNDPSGTPSNYRFIGSSLDTVQHSCSSILNATNNTDYWTAQYHEWPNATYTIDGNTVYAIVHNEWYPTLADPSCTWGWVNSLTLVVSTDGGAHFTHPSDYKIRIPAVPWDNSNSAFVCHNPYPNDTKYGSFEPSSIVAKDGYYYNIFYYQEDPIAAQGGYVVGNCIMRTQDLAHGSSWQVWTGQGWSSALNTPNCAFISPTALSGAYIKSISYNTYLHSYIGLATTYTGGTGGVGYTLSQDLINWTTPVLLLPSQSVPQGQIAYPSLLDPSDTSRNFEMTGQTPYVYLMRWDGSSMDRDLLRQQIKFTSLVTPPASCTWNGQTVASGSSVTAYQSPTVPYGSVCSSVAQTRTCQNGVLSGTYTYAACTVNAPASCTFNGQTVANGQSITAYQTSSASYGSQCVSEQRSCSNGTLSGSYPSAACSVQAAASCAFNGAAVANGQSVTAYQSPSVPYGQICSSISQSRTCTNGVLSGSYTNASCVVGTPAACTFNNQSIANGASITAYQSSTVPFGQTCSSQSRTCANGILSGTYQSSACAVAPPASCTWNGQSVAHGSSVTAYQASSVAFGQACTSEARTCSNGTLSGSYANAMCVVGAAGSCTFNNQSLVNGASVTAYQSSTVLFGQICSSQSRICTNGVLSGTYQSAACSVQPAASCSWNGQSVASGASITGYQSSSVSSGQQCISQARMCTDGTLSGTYANATCTIEPATSGGSSGGSSGGGPATSGVTIVPSTEPAASTVVSTNPTIAALQAQVAALLAQLLSLQKAQSGSAPASSGFSGATACPQLVKNISRGSRGTDVTALQKFLFTQYENFPAATGYYGSITEAAVKQWQSEHHLISTGSPSITGWGAVGPKTRSAIASACASH